MAERASRALPSAELFAQRGKLAGVVAACVAVAALDPTALAQAPAAPAPMSDQEREARAHFDDGNALLEKNAYVEALAEFLAARRLYSRPSATTNAIYCLRQLGRYDEALDLTEAYLREFPDLPPDKRTEAEAEAADLAKRVGTIVIEGAEPGAAWTIDGRGRGALPESASARVSAGAHLVRVSKDGLVPFEVRVEVAAEQTARIAVKLRAPPRDTPLPRAPVTAPRRFSLELAGTALVLPLGGGFTEGCTSPCSASPGLGASGVLRGGYAITPSVSAGLTAGFLGVEQTLTGRETTLTPVGKPVRHGTVADALKLRGALVGAWTALLFGERPFFQLRLGAGALIGWLADTRTGTFQSDDSASYDVGPDSVTPFAAFAFIEPEARIGVRVNERIALTAGVGALFLFGGSKPPWTRPIHAPSDGLATYPAETLFGEAAFAFAPSVGARYDF